MSIPPLIGLGAACAIAAAAWKARALTVSGALAAAAVGFAHVWGAHWLGTGALLAFFVTSTGLSKLGRAAKERLDFEKGGTRDAAQVLANGGAAALAAILAGLYPEALWPKAALLGALAAANADTWATEIGSWRGGVPRRITDLKPAAPGESGAISVVGTLAALAGAALLGGVGLCFGLPLRLAALVTGAGLAGALLDSLLGATIQRQFRCTVCGKITERAEHCGAPTVPARGLRVMNNDVVNAAATIAAAAIAGLVAHS